MKPFLLLLHKLLRRSARPFFPGARLFSNALIRKYGVLAEGSVINVSGWDDRDKNGGHYHDYFPNCREYAISNAPSVEKGAGSAGDSEIVLDLETDLDPSLAGKFDFVLNHTTLEHVFHFEKAFANLCALSCDAVMLVVPLIQNLHILPSYGDYWRPTPIALARLFQENGLEPLVISSNEQPFGPIYCFCLAVRDPSKYASLRREIRYEMGWSLFGGARLKGDPSVFTNPK